MQFSILYLNMMTFVYENESSPGFEPPLPITTILEASSLLVKGKSLQKL